MKKSALLKELTDITEQVLREAENLKAISVEQLNKKPAPESWSALECLEHLNRYGNFYIPEINQRLSKAQKSPKDSFSTGWLGNYFAKSMKPDAKPMKTFKSMDPSDSNVDLSVLDTFIKQQQDFLDILKRCKDYNLTKVKTSISISKWLKLRLGDTLRVVIYHNQRHMQQAQRALSSAKT